MVAVQAVRGLDSQGLLEAHGGNDPSPGMPSGKFKLEDVLGAEAEAPSPYEGILPKFRGSQKGYAPQVLSRVVESSWMTAWDAQLQRMPTQRSQVWNPALM
jgi:hypothetical protein